MTIPLEGKALVRAVYDWYGNDPSRWYQSGLCPGLQDTDCEGYAADCVNNARCGCLTGVAIAVGGTAFWLAKALGFRFAAAVSVWNDAPGRTFAEVQALLEAHL